LLKVDIERDAYITMVYNVSRQRGVLEYFTAERTGEERRLGTPPSLVMGRCGKANLRITQVNDLL
jgi:hypothetical protein